jgi:Tat protein translocase TatB subunit
MDFFGIGPLELLLILVLFVIVVGPDKLPEVGRRLGAAMKAFRGATDQITREIDREVKSVEQNVSEAAKEVENMPPVQKQPPSNGTKQA